MNIPVWLVVVGLLGAMPSLAGGALKKLEFDKGKLPKGLSYQGKVVDGARWIDKNGENLLVLTQTGAFASKSASSSDGRDAWLYGYHFIVEKGKVRQLWKIQDFEKDCPFDLYVGFIKDSITVTDLDADGVAETAFLYKLTCRSDVSPSSMKLIMHEGQDKYALRGSMSMVKMGMQKDRMTPDPAYSKAPKKFLSFSIERWKKFREETTFDQF